MNPVAEKESVRATVGSPLTGGARTALAFAKHVRVGLLALQGDFAMHRQIVEGLGYDCSDVRTIDELHRVDCLIMPGGESTTMRKLMIAEGMFDTLAEFARTKPVMGTCAGLILLAKRVAGSVDERTLGVLDCDVDRNAYGSQFHSFRQTGEIAMNGTRAPLEMVFIRAPRIVRVGEGVDVLGRLNGEPTLVRQGNILAMAFHPEMSGDPTVHRFFIEEIAVAALSQ